MFLAASMLTSSLSPGQDMKLVNTKTGFVVVAFKDGKSAFYDRFLEEEMKETGIYIPPAMRKDFENKEVIFLGEDLFEKAFLEVYYPLSIANSVYKWE